MLRFKVQKKRNMLENGIVRMRGERLVIEILSRLKICNEADGKTSTFGSFIP